MTKQSETSPFNNIAAVTPALSILYFEVITRLFARAEDTEQILKAEMGPLPGLKKYF